MKKRPISNRKCGGCTVCCLTHSVSEVNTRAGEWCQYCDIGKGCKIYRRRPLACQRYKCVWLAGKGGKSDRPDRLEIVMDGCLETFRGKEVPILNFHEVEAGAINQPRVQQIMVANLEVGNVAVHHILGVREPPTYYFPKGKWSEWEQYVFIEIVETGGSFDE